MPKKNLKIECARFKMINFQPAKNTETRFWELLDNVCCKWKEMKISFHCSANCGTEVIYWTGVFVWQQNSMQPSGGKNVENVERKQQGKPRNSHPPQ